MINSNLLRDLFYVLYTWQTSWGNQCTYHADIWYYPITPSSISLVKQQLFNDAAVEQMQQQNLQWLKQWIKKTSSIIKTFKNENWIIPAFEYYTEQLVYQQHQRHLLCHIKVHTKAWYSKNGAQGKYLKIRISDIRSLSLTNKSDQYDLLRFRKHSGALWQPCSLSFSFFCYCFCFYKCVHHNC